MLLKFFIPLVLLLVLLSCSNQSTDQENIPSAEIIKQKFDLAAKAKIDSMRNNPVSANKRNFLRPARLFANRMAVKLSLRPVQKRKIVKIRMEFLEEEQKIESQKEMSPEERKKAMNLLNLKSKEKFSSVLDHDQRQIWMKARKATTEN